jgi:hypothetical protein
MTIYSTIIINAGYICLLFSFLVDNIYVLRILSIFANIFLLLWAALYVDYPDYISLVVWCSVFIVINTGYIIKYKFCKKNNENTT